MEPADWYLVRKIKMLGRRELTAVIAGSIGFQGVDILASYCFVLGLRIELPFSYFLVLFPIVYLVTVLPISLGGLGVRESILVYFLHQAGVTASDAVSLSFLIYFNRVFAALIGGGSQVFSKHSNRSVWRFAKSEAEL